MQSQEAPDEDEAPQVNEEQKEEEQQGEQERKFQDVLGLDFGSASFGLSLFRAEDAAPELVRNELANRTTPSLVVFHQGQRHVGESAVPLLTRGTVLSRIKQDLAQGRATTVSYGGADVSIEAIHAGSMLFSRVARDLDRSTGAETEGEARVRKLRVSAPPCFPREGVARLLQAAQLSGFLVEQPVLFDVSCAALLWGKRRRADEDATVLFVDVGHSYSSAQVARFSANKMHVLATASVEGGAGLFDSCIVDIWSEELRRKHPRVDLSSRRTQARLFKEAAKTKERLSTIGEVRVSIESLTPEVDFAGVTKRADMEQRCALLGLLQGALEKVLSDAGGAEVLTRVEVVGGGSRIPSVADLVSSLVPGLELCKTLDSEHATTFGCALFGGLGDDYEVSGEYAFETVDASAEDTTEVLRLEATMKADDDERHARQAAKNKMEGFVFDTRRAAEGSKLLDDEARTTLLALLRDKEEWLMDHGDESTSLQLAEALEALTSEARSLATAMFDDMEKRRKKQEEEDARIRLEALEKKPAAAAGKKKVVRPAEKIQTALARKDHGNRLFKDNNFEDATRRYTQALGLCSELNGTVPPDQQEQVDAIKLSCYLNLSLCNLKLKHTGLARHNAESALKLDPDNLKASFRLAQALLELKELEEAQKVVKEALVKHEDNGGLLSIKARVERALAIQKKKSQKMYGAMFG